MPTFQRAAIYLVFLWVLGRGLEALGGGIWDVGSFLLFASMGGMKIHIDKKIHHSNSIINGQNLQFSVFWGDFD